MNEPRRQMDEAEAGATFQWTGRPRRAKPAMWRLVLSAVLAGIAVFALAYGSVQLYATLVGW